MVELFDQNIRTQDRQSSKGNQLKWKSEGIWYKADYTGYEGLVEYMVSHLLKKSSLAENEFQNLSFSLTQSKRPQKHYISEAPQHWVFKVVEGLVS